MFEYKFEMPAVTVTGIVFFRRNNALHFIMCKRGDYVDAYPGHYCFMGGFLDTGKETVIDALIREAKEELSLVSTPSNWALFHIQDTFADVDSRNKHTVNICYFMELKNSEEVLMLEAGDDISSFDILNIGQVKSIRLAFDHETILDKFLDAHQLWWRD